MQIINQFGLVLNFLGTLLVAFSFGDPPSAAFQYNKNGNKVNLAAFLHPKGFKLGLLCLVVGFLMMFIATF